MKKGDIVKVYQDPITQTDLEGEAALLERVPYTDKGMERWEVKFIDDGMVTHRLIKAETIS